MGRVQVLDKHTAELIAAGEVVERPASVIKELCENSIDAGADAVTVEIKNGGASMIKITDNGEGMEREDVPTAFLRHATSKISTGEDLDAIMTLGFRGEALASICAVSKVELITRTAQNDVGTRYVIEGGEEVSLTDCGCAKGTVITVRDLFYNTPARMKFLKKDVSEANAAAAVVDKLALSHPEVSFRFIRDGKQTLMTPGDGELRSAIHAVFGREFTEGLMKVDYEYNGVKVSGYTSKPICSRPNRSMQTFFINGRCCRNSAMQASLEEAYRGAIMVGKHPACVLNIEMNCSAVDVNVHPAKLEVRFTNERPVTSCIYYAVKSAIENNDERPELKIAKQEPPRPVYTAPQPQIVQTKLPEDIKLPEPVKPVVTAVQKKEPVYSSAAPMEVKDSSYEDAMQRYKSLFASDDVPSAPHARYPQKANIDIEVDNIAPAEVSETAARTESVNVLVSVQEQANIKPPMQEALDTPADTGFELGDWRMVGEAFATYLILESGDKLILIDKHAAHERLIYERLKAEQDDAQMQYLLEPRTVVLEKKQYDAVLQNTELLAKAGFEVEDFGSGTVIVRSVPCVLSGSDAADAIAEIAGRLGGMNETFIERLDNLFHTVACRSAIKAHDKTTERELCELALKLEADPSIRYCPHGRPISITLTKKELEKSFGRI